MSKYWNRSKPAALITGPEAAVGTDQETEAADVTVPRPAADKPN